MGSPKARRKGGLIALLMDQSSGRELRRAEDILPKKFDDDIVPFKPSSLSDTFSGIDIFRYFAVLDGHLCNGASSPKFDILSPRIK
jgi:hypothetical protein